MTVETEPLPQPSTQRPLPVGLILANFPRKQVPAFKYFLLLLNHLQKTFEFAFYDVPASDPLITAVSASGLIEADSLRPHLLSFEDSLRENAKKRIKQFDLAENFPSQLIVVSRATLTNYHYLIREGQVSLLALGEWERSMAPPSAAEFVQLVVLRAAYSATEKGAWNTIHLGTRSCVFDFTRNLQDTRMMTLTGLGVCADCGDALKVDGFADAPAELRHVAEKSWLGKRSEPGTPANIMARFGYDLYFTRGFSATFGERLRQLLEEDAAKELIKLVFLILGTALLVWWNLKKP